MLRMGWPVVLTVTAIAAISCGDNLPEKYAVSDNRASNTTCLPWPSDRNTGRLTLERAFTHALRDGSKLKKLTTLVQSPQDSLRWYLTTQDGQVYHFSSNTEENAMTLALDLSDRGEYSGTEKGLVSFALSADLPDYAFVVYSVPPQGQGSFVSRLSRFTFDGNILDASSELVILDIPQYSGTHSGNHIAFDNEGYLYYSIGEDKQNTLAQNTASLKGKVLRIDVSQASAQSPYTTPEDNPFAEGGGAPEVYAYGLRNPWRFSIDATTQEIFLGDVGRDRREEVNKIIAGGNYGWPLREGTLCHIEDPCEDPDFIDPIVEFNHSEGRSVVGGVLYEGDNEDLEGHLIYGDYVTGNIWSVNPQREQEPSRLEIEGEFLLSSFTKSQEGEIFILRYDPQGEDGGVYRLASQTPAASEVPKLLSETGCFDPENPSQVRSGVIAYSPTATLWSDGAEKDRFFAIPDDQRIRVDNEGDLIFPKGSVLIKHFRFGDKLHETRLLLKYDDTWAGYSYEWKEDQSDATILPSAKTKILENGVRWTYPSRSQCSVCHTNAANNVLGLEVATLDHALEPGGDNQLQWMLAHDYFTPSTKDYEVIRERMPPLVDPYGDAPLGDRVRSYLHANCSMCHRPGGNGRGEIDLRLSRSFAEMKLCDELPKEGRIWGEGPGKDQRLISPGSPADSILYLRMKLLGIFRMPVLGSDRVDEQATEMVFQWINSMQDCNSVQ